MLPTDDGLGVLKRRSEGIAKLLEVYLRTREASVGLIKLRNMVAHGEGGFDQLPSETTFVVEKVLSEGERALETKQNTITQPQLVIQGFGGWCLNLRMRSVPGVVATGSPLIARIPG